MSTEILLNINIPTLSQSSDVLAPDFLPVDKLIPLIVAAMEDISEKRYQSSRAEVLCSELGVLSPSLSLKQQGIQNGAQLWLF